MTAGEAATRLGVKRQTLYAYVSRGLIERTVAADGRTSLFDPAAVERLRQGRKPDADGELQTLIATQLTRIDDGTLSIRGQNLIERVAGGFSFTDAADLLWDAPSTESWAAPPSPQTWVTPRPETDTPQRPGTDDQSPGLLDELRVLVARCSAADPLRHDLSPRSVRAAGRHVIWTLARGLPPRSAGTDDTIARSMWRRLSPVANDTADGDRSHERVRALDAAMALLIDHGLASSTFAARIAASVRADPYSVIGAGLGALGGPLHGAASSGVHELLCELEGSNNPAQVVGETRRRLGRFPGFGHMVYRTQDPRYGALMAIIVRAWGDDPRLVNVYRVRDLVSERSDAIANVDLGLGALTYLARMPLDAGEMIFAAARTAGWLAHAMEEYNEEPLRFRPKARYTGI